MKKITEEEVKDDLEENDDEIIEDVESLKDEKTITVYSRDWTIQTVYDQIEKDNIDLRPKFQRRNAWKDDKKSRLIESFLLTLPVPEIILAERSDRPKSFIVIDGKQRLLTIAGFIDPEKYDYWRKPTLSGLKSLVDLNDMDYETMKKEPKFANQVRMLLNSDIRCTVISGYKSIDVLYDIFYRLNTGSVLLSTQELRQVLNRGPFADYLYKVTNTVQPIHKIMGLSEPDPRLFDMEFILRFISFALNGKNYKGNLKKFLDNTMGDFNKEWDKYQKNINDTYELMNNGIENLNKVFGANEIGRRFVSGAYFQKYNKVVTEVEIFYFSQLKKKDLSAPKNKKFKKLFEKMSMENETFNDTINKSTKDLSKYQDRYKLFRNIVNEAYGTNFKNSPVVEEQLQI